MPTDAAAKPNDDFGPRQPATLAQPLRPRTPGTICVAGWPAAVDSRRRRNDWVLAELLFEPRVMPVPRSPARKLSSGHARLPGRSSAERSPEGGAERKRRRADSPRGS